MKEEPVGGSFGRIDGITKNGSAKIFEMDAELVSTAGSRAKLKQRILVVAGNDFVISLRRFTVLADLESRGAFEITGDGEVDHGFSELGVADHDRIVSFVGFAILELFAEHGLGGWVFGKNDDAAGVAVETMDE